MASLRNNFHTDDLQSQPVCRRCSEDAAATQIRSESVCKKCFCQYVMTKAIKRMETYRIRGASLKSPKKALLPISFGPSSASLLSILDRHLQSQYDRVARCAYELYVVHIDIYVDERDRKSSECLLGIYKERFPRHTYMSLGLEEALHLRDIDWDAFGLSQYSLSDTTSASTETLQEVIGVLTSATSKVDFISILLNRLLVDVAKKTGCETILFGDSTTRLAEKTLVQTAKGRGFSLPWQVSDGMSPHGVRFVYPLRDVLNKELVAFSTLTEPNLSELISLDVPPIQNTASPKSVTIDSLLAQYFESVEQNYPSIVANVVRTTSKLGPDTPADAKICGLCGLPVAPGADGIFGWGGDQSSEATLQSAVRQSGMLCYGCSRSIND